MLGLQKILRRHHLPNITKTWEIIQKTTENKIDGLIFTKIDQGIIKTWEWYKEYKINLTYT